MKKTLLIALIITVNFSIAQQFTIPNQITFGGNKSEFVKSIIHTYDNKIVVVGSSNSPVSFDKSEPNRGGGNQYMDFWVVKYDTDLNEIWQKTIGGEGLDKSACGIELSDHNYLIGGCSFSDISGDKTQAQIGSSDYWLIKLSQTGEILWQKVYGGEDGEGITDILELSDGSLILGGTSSSDISGDKSENSRGYSDCWIIKTDASGNKIWDKTIGSDYFDKNPQIFNDADNNIYLVATTRGNSSGDKTDDSFGDTEDAWLIKLDSEGNVLWDKTIGSYGDETGTILYHQNFIYLFMSSNSDIGGYKTEDHLGNYYHMDYWVVKLDLDGNFIWDKTIGGTSGDWAIDIVAINETELLLSGQSRSQVSGNKSEPRVGLNDNWLVKIDTSGNILWDKTIGGNKTEYGFKVAVINPNEFMLAGASESDISGDKTGYCKGESDFWICKLDVSTDIPSFQSKVSCNVYPNPSKDILYIDLEDKSFKTQIYNTQGKLLSETENSNTISIKNLEQGIYLLKVITQKGIYSQEIIKE